MAKGIGLYLDYDKKILKDFRQKGNKTGCFKPKTTEETDISISEMSFISINR